MRSAAGKMIRVNDMEQRQAYLIAAGAYIGRVLDQCSADREAERRYARELTEQGHRLVGGGQVGDGGQWEITDALTGEILATGTGYESYQAAGQDSWHHVDHLRDDTWADTAGPSALFDDLGLTKEQARALDELTWESVSSGYAELIAALAGRTMAEVAAAVAELSVRDLLVSGPTMPPDGTAPV